MVDTHDSDDLPDTPSLSHQEKPAAIIVSNDAAEMM